MATIMTPKKKMFAKEYLKDLNGTQAAIRAGYSEKTAKEQAARLLSDVNVRAEIERLMEKRSERVEFCADDALQALKKIVRFNIKSLYHEDGRLKQVHELDDDAAAAISGIDVAEGIPTVFKYRTHDKNKAVDMAMKHFGLYEKDNEQKGAAMDAIYKGRERAGLKNETE